MRSHQELQPWVSHASPTSVGSQHDQGQDSSTLSTPLLQSGQNFGKTETAPAERQKKKCARWDFHRLTLTNDYGERPPAQQVVVTLKEEHPRTIGAGKDSGSKGL